jgi:ABC-type nitrate/sulfonate/bicarbonate transport system permease component
MSSTRRTRLLNLASPLVFLLRWELAVRAGLIDGRMFPAPSEIAVRFWSMAISGELWRHVGASLWRVTIGFALGATAGAIVGIIMGLSLNVRAIVQPLIAATYPIPRTAIVPLFLIIFGLGEMSKIMIVALSVFYVVLINAMSGVMSIDRVYLDVGKDLDASRLNAFLTIALPGAFPTIMSGMKLGVGLSFIVLVVAEATGAETGIGYMIWSGWQTLDLDQMYVGLLTVAMLGWLSSMFMDEIEWYLVPWQRNR